MSLSSISPNQRRIAEAAVLVLYFLFEAHNDWSTNHGWALFSGAFGTIVVLAIELPIGWWAVVSGVIAVGVFVAYLLAGPAQLPTPTPAPTVVLIPPAAGQPRTYNGEPGIPLEDTRVYGALKPANEPTPPNGCDGAPIPLAPDALKVLIGDNAITHDGPGSFTAIGIKACSAISMERTPKGIFVNASLYDPEKQAVVSIRDNQITALNGENYTARQSRDESRLTVRNARGIELFYIRYLNPTTVQFRGFLGCAAGPIVHVQDGQPIPGFFMNDSCLPGARVGIQIGPP